MKYSSIFSMLSFFILFACNETAVYGSDENIIFMRYVEKLHLDKYSVKNTVNAYSALFDHGLASKSDQRFASIRSTGNLTFSTAF